MQQNEPPVEAQHSVLLGLEAREAAGREAWSRARGLSGGRGAGHGWAGTRGRWDVQLPTEQLSSSVSPLEGLEDLPNMAQASGPSLQPLTKAPVAFQQAALSKD